MANLVRRAYRTGRWYDDLSLGEKAMVAMSLGSVAGTLYGTYVRRSAMNVLESDYLVTSTYHVPEGKKKEFESVWSHTAQLAQRQPGYEWTKTFKAIDWDESPFHYIAFRMWSEAGAYRHFANYDPTLKELNSRLSEVCTEKSHVYKVIVDDSVNRIIY